MRLSTIFLSAFLFLGSVATKAQALEDAPTERMNLAKFTHIYPNPATDFIYIKLDQLSIDKMKITMHNIIGNQINIETEVMSEYEVRIRVKDFAAGYYLLALKDDKTKFSGTFKFVKR